MQFAGYTSYLNFYAGHRNIRVSPFNADNVIIDTTLTFTEGQAYSLFYVNRVANIRALLVKDSRVNPGEEKQRSGLLTCLPMRRPLR